MNILAFDTAYSGCTVALQFNQRIASRFEDTTSQQTHYILPLIEELLAEVGASIADLDFIAYGRGPGRFTGVRIANALAQGLAYAHHKPLIPISSLAVLAQSAAIKHGWPCIVTAVDARMGQIYLACFEVNHTGMVELRGQEEVYNLKENQKLHDQLGSTMLANRQVVKNFTDLSITSAVGTTSFWGVGDGWLIKDPNLVSLMTSPPIEIAANMTTSPEGLLLLAERQWRQEGGVAAHQAFPNYLR
ncbi:MAG: tRNA (adenosine(37)-N6)-threonylcarbamoyltransferase complex dimerization subunit type 1 TsaB [Gammaproteobacteria bacterium]|nr:tRNA (adenosine(37)-N6)-threonylcarbamoyltransferase complex dimerization subunit type 1 TsaB [Gammaproteobacteria bacterium]